MAEHDTIEISTRAGTHPLELYRASNAAAPVVVCLPALGITARYYRKLAQALSNGGAHAVLADLPGHGNSPLRASRSDEWGYRGLVEHCESVREAVQRALPDSNFFWLGHSLGGHAALLHAGLHGQRVAGVALVASGTPYYRCWTGTGRTRIWMLTQLLATIARTVGYAPGRLLGSRTNEPRQLILEWAHVARNGIYACSDFDGEAALRAFTRPVLAIALKGDALAPQAAIEHNLKKLSSPSIERWTWEPTERLHHNSWPRKPEGAAERVLDWIAQVR